MAKRLNVPVKKRNPQDSTRANVTKLRAEVRASIKVQAAQIRALQKAVIALRGRY